MTAIRWRIAVIAVLAGIAAGGVTQRAARAAPFVPTRDDLVLETVPEAGDPAGRQLRALMRRWMADPHDLTLASQIARLDLAEGRRLGDPRMSGRAEAVLAPWPTGPDTPPTVLLLRAIVLQGNHDFDGSIALLHRLLAVDPGSRQGWLTLASVHQARAEYGAALSACGQFAATTLGLSPDVCIASAMSLTGHARIALAALTLSMAQNRAEIVADPSVGVWAASEAAEVAERLGDPSTEARFRASLAIDPTDPYLLAAWSDFLLDARRPREVIVLLAAQTRNDVLLLRLAEAERATGDPAAAGHVADLAERFETSRRRGETIHRREEARFVLRLEHDPGRALTLAVLNWQVQREPADARILLEAADAAGEPQAAEPVRRWWMANHVEDVRLAARAGLQAGGS